MMRSASTRLLTLSLALAIGSCAADDDPDFGETWPEQISLRRIDPLTILPTTTMRVEGSGFVTSILGTTRLRMQGVAMSESGQSTTVDANLLVSVESSTQLSVQMDRLVFREVCPFGVGSFSGQASIEVASIQTNQVYRPSTISVQLKCATSLIPGFSSIQSGPSTLNAPMTVQAQDVLLGGAEGTTSLVVNGCFLPRGSAPPCETSGRPIVDQNIPLTVLNSTARRDGTVLLSPELVGIRPGRLESRVRLINVDANGVSTASEQQFWNVDVLPSSLAFVESEGASLGGYVQFQGAGFIGGASDEVMEIQLDGIFDADNGRADRAIRLSLITEYQAGDIVRYVLDEEDELGEKIDLRSESGTFVGEFAVRLRKGNDIVTIDPINSSFRIEPVRQVVHVVFTQGFIDALAQFGLRAMEGLVRETMIRRAQETFAGIGVEFRTTKPEDYRLFSTVEITGTDPNGIGLIGYDNTPGKDDGNLRLYDQIGGVHAQTQEDGFPGYGGVFLQSFFAFSKHPPRGVQPNPGASEIFDQIFDPFRPDRGGRPVEVREIDQVQSLVDGSRCPTSSDRTQAIGCAVFVLGNLLGGTMAHEIAHSVGLADPGGDQFHNRRDRPNHLMDSGFDRPFTERAQLNGMGPEFFCVENYAYLTEILPTSESDPMDGRTSCF